MANAQQQAEQLKNQGNAALKEGNTAEAIEFYTKALKLDPNNQVLYSNRSAAYCKAKDYAQAIADAEKVIEIKPDWAKGYSRKGAALGFLGNHEEALMTYMEGLDHDSSNEQLKQAIREAKSHLTGPGDSQALVNPFADAHIWEKLQADERTKSYMADPEFRNIIGKLQKDPKQLGTHMHDSRVMAALGVLLGVQMGFGGDDLPEVPKKEAAPQPKEAKTYTSKQNQNEKEAKSAVLNASQQQALQEKELGNGAYKKKEFEVALVHYSKAVELDPTNIVFRNNRAAVFYEQKEYEKCIKECEEAVEIGREHRADYKLIAKSFARQGNAFMQMKEYERALTFYNKSLSEHRDQDVVKKAQQADKAMKELIRLAYINPEEALIEKQKGNEYFTKGDYPSAMKHYSEAIKRNPDDAKLYSNRAACYTKLLEFNMALKDCDDCIRLDPTFIKGYLRKGATLVALKNFSKAGELYQKALELDPNCQEAIDGYRRCSVQENDPEAVKLRAMNDPEVQQILGDPAMQLILQQMQKDPRALQDHLKNPEIAKKIEKLMEVGLIALR